MKVHVKISLMMFIYLFIVIIILPIYDIPARLLSQEVDTMDDGWEVSAAGATYSNVTINKLGASGIKIPSRGDSITFSKPLTAELVSENEVTQPAILITSTSSIVRATLDGVELLAQSTNPAENKPFYVPGKELLMVDLPEDYSGKLLELTFTSEENLSYTGIVPPLFGERLTLTRYTAYRGMRSMLVGVFMSVYGVLFVIVSAFFSKKVPQIQGQVYAAAICILIGVWMLCYNEFFVLLYPGFNTTLMEFFCQFLSVPVFYVFLFKLNMPIKKQYEKVVAVALSVFSVTAISLWILLKNFTSILMLLFIIFLFFGLTILTRYYRSIRKTRNMDYSVFMQINGLSIMMLACLIQCLLYYIEDLRGLPRGIFGRNVMSVGVSTLAVSQMLNFFFLVTREVAGKSGDVPLAEMAYHDALTGIYNRSKTDEVTEKILHSKDDFCIVMLDLNGLKEVNDENGHLSGDHLLKEFAQVLRICIRKSAFYARIGGDEFIIIIENPAPDQAEELIDRIRTGFDKLNQSEPDIIHSFAAGYATGFEAENIYNLDGHDRDKVWKFTMKLADSRMYEQKAAIKTTKK